MNRSRGFTLVELLITLTVGAILLGAVGPSFFDMLSNNRLVSTANTVLGTMNAARSRAITHGSTVTVTATGGNWSNGWTITEAGVLLKTFPAIPPTQTITSALATFDYTPTGTVNPAVGGTWTLCDNRTAETGRTIDISRTGRPSVSEVACP